MLQFASPERLWLSLLLLITSMAFLVYLRWRRNSIRNIGTPTILKEVMKGASKSRYITKFILHISAIILLIIAFAQPRVITSLEKKDLTGNDIMICLDISNSMLAEDIKPNRLIRARQSLSGFLRRLRKEQTGLILFAGEAYIQVPLTIDRGTTSMLLNNISIRDISQQGTAIADAIRLATQSFQSGSNQTGNRFIILVTDGEDHEGSVLEEAKIAANEGIVIYTIGVGDPTGVPVPVYEEGILSGYMKDRDGNTVISAMNAKLLTEIASLTGGTFYSGNNLSKALTKIREDMDTLPQVSREVHNPEHYSEQFQWFAGLALLFILIDILLPYGRNRKRLWEKISL